MLIREGFVQHSNWIIRKWYSAQAKAFYAHVGALMQMFSLDFSDAYMQALEQWPSYAEWQPE